MQVEVVLAAAAAIGESPTWVAEERVLYWIDVKAPALHRLDPTTRGQRSWTLPDDVGAFALTTDRNQVLVALRSGLSLLDLASGAISRLVPAPFDTGLFRFNEGACDRSGRFWVGVMFDPVGNTHAAPRRGHLFRYGSDDGLRCMDDRAELHNGMGWNVDETLFYLAHSDTNIIYAYPFDAAAGTLGRRAPFAVIEPGSGLPDGAAIDSEGGYWCALHGGGRLRRYRSDGTLDREVRLPVSQPTMCAFGGPARDILYVTSAARGLDAARRLAEPQAGAVLALRPGIAGLQREHRFRL